MKIAIDKKKHVYVGVIIALSGLIFFLFIHLPYNWDKFVCFALVTIAAVGKELVWDKWMKRGQADFYDALATLIAGWSVIFLWGIVEAIIKTIA